MVPPYKTVRIPKPERNSLPCSGPGKRTDSKRKRRQVLLRDEFICQQCHEEYPEYNLEADHIIPLHQGGPDNLHNMQTLCIECHKRKTNTERIRHGG